MSKPEEVFNTQHTLVLGAFISFVGTFIIAFVAGTEPAICLRNSVFAAIIGLMLTKVFIFFLEANISAAKRQKQEQELAASSEEHKE